MRRIVMLLLVSIILLNGCFYKEDLSSVPSQKTSEIIMLNGMSFNVNGLEGTPQDFLLNNYQNVIYYNGTQMESVLDTPLMLLIRESGNNVFVGYDKPSGVFYNTCEDEKGIHENCIWTSFDKIVFCGTDRIFFVFYDDNESVIYSCDFLGENKTKLYKSEHTVQKVFQEGNYIYFLESGIIDGETSERVCRLNLTDFSVKLLLSEKDLYYFMPLNENLLYLSPKDNNYYIFNPNDNSVKYFADNTILPIAYCKNNLYFMQDGIICCKNQSGFGKTEYLFEGDVSQLFFTSDSVYRYVYKDGVYKHSYDFSENKLVFSFKDYSRPTIFSISEEMLSFTYAVGNGKSKETHIVIVDLKTNKKFDAVI